MASAEQWQRMSENATDGRRCRCIQKWLAKEWLLARRRAAFWVQKSAHKIRVKVSKGNI